MPLSALPVEIKLHICEQLDAFSAFDFALTCKRLGELFEPVVKDGQSVFDSYKEMGSYIIQEPWGDAEHMVTNSDHASYVRDFDLLPHRYYWDDCVHRFQLTPRSCRPPPHLCKRFIAAVRHIEPLYAGVRAGISDLWPTMKEAISDGSPEPLIALLVHHMTLLKSFRITVMSDTEDEFRFFQMLKLIAAAYRNLLTAPHLPFQCLMTMAVGHAHDGHFRPDWYIVASAIPSLRNFAAAQMGGQVRRTYPDLRRSPVKHLLFLNSAVFEYCMTQILGNTEGLQSFGYEFGQPMMNGPGRHPRDLINLLDRYTKSSLEHLTLQDGRWQDYSYTAGHVLNPPCLRGFENLQTLRCGYMYLRPLTSADIDVLARPSSCVTPSDLSFQPDFDPRTLLPKSLEILQLDCPSYVDNFTWDALKNMMSQPSEFTPHLKHVFLFRERNMPLHQGVESHWCTEGSDWYAEFRPDCWNTPLAENFKGGYGYDPAEME